jgi:hypothetical protein
MTITEGSTAEIVQVPVARPGAVFVPPRPEPDKGKPASVAAAAALVDDANYLLDAIARNDLGKAKISAIAEEDIKTLAKAVHEQQTAGGLSLEMRTSLVLSLSHVFTAIAPVTMCTLRDTDPSKCYGRLWWAFGLFPTYQARWLSRKLLAATFIFMLIAVAGDVLLRHYGKPGDGSAPASAVALVLHVLTPFTYGAVGACVFLLRSLHVFIYERTYDYRRESEYANRILLGMVSGGAVVVLIEQLSGNDGTVIRFSSAALGFLTGYNTDFLFSTIERVTAAILPKASTPSDTTPDGKSK